MRSRKQPEMLPNICIYVQISKEGEGRKAIWLDSLIHAREWIAGATVLKIMDNVCYLINLKLSNFCLFKVITAF